MSKCRLSWKIISIFLPLLNSGLLALSILTYLTSSAFEAFRYVFLYIITNLTMASFSLFMENYLFENEDSRFDYGELIYLSALSFFTAGAACIFHMKKLGRSPSKWIIVSTVIATLGFMVSFWMYYFIDKACLIGEIDEFYFSV